MTPRLPRGLWAAILASTACVLISCSTDVRETGSQSAVTIAARQRLAAATVELANTLETCSQKEKPLDARVFAGIELTLQQFGVALSYLSVKANNHCVQNAAGQFAIAVRVMQQSHSAKATSSEQFTNDYADLVADSVLRELELHSEFLNLPKSARDKLERIVQLTAPFDAVATIDGLDRARHQTSTN
jgi:hypothetical protein